MRRYLLVVCPLWLCSASSKLCQALTAQLRTRRHAPNRRQQYSRAPTTSPPLPHLLAAANNNNNERYQISYGSRDFWHNIQSLPRSTVLRATKQPVCLIMGWSLVLVLCVIKRIQVVGRVPIPLLPSSMLHSTTVSALSLLLVFRTTSAYQRFNEGRHIWEQCLGVCRCFSRFLHLYPELDSVRPQLLQWLSGFPYFLHQHIQEKCTDDPPVDLEQLPWKDLSHTDTQALLSCDNRPLYILHQMANGINTIPYTDTYTNREREKLYQYIDKLSDAVGECERIHQTAVPVHYARHSLRALTLWLFSLPLLLVNSYGFWTPLIMGMVSWTMMGIYQIGHKIEDPFQGSLRLTTLCQEIYQNVQRSPSAFVVTVNSDEWKQLLQNED